MKKFDTVLFDFDGTVMNTNEVILRSWQHTFQTIENREEDEAKIIATFGEPLDVTMGKFFPDMPRDEAVEIYRSYHRDNFGDLITVFPGMKELLAEVKIRGYKTGLVTSRLLHTTQQGLEKYELKDYFDVVVTAEDTENTNRIRNRSISLWKNFIPCRGIPLCLETPCSISSVRKTPALLPFW